MGFSQEDWLIIDEVLNKVAKELRRIVREKRKTSKETQKGSTLTDTSSQQDNANNYPLLG